MKNLGNKANLEGYDRVNCEERMDFLVNSYVGGKMTCEDILLEKDKVKSLIDRYETLVKGISGKVSYRILKSMLNESKSIRKLEDLK